MFARVRGDKGLSAGAATDERDTDDLAGGGERSAVEEAAGREGQGSDGDDHGRYWIVRRALRT